MFKTHRHHETQSDIAHAEFTSTQDENGIDSEYEQLKNEITPAPQNEIDIDVPYAIHGGENRKDADMELMENVNVKNRKHDICKGGTVATTGKMQLAHMEAQRQKSMEHMLKSQLVKNKKNKFEQMIKDNAKKTAHKQKHLAVPAINDNNMDRNSIDIELDADDDEQQQENEHAIGQYDDRTMIFQSDEISPMPSDHERV